MAGIAAFLVALCAGVGCYLFLAFHFGHVWSLFFVAGFLFVAFLAPALCFGYDPHEEYMFMNVQMSEQSFMNCRDLGYIAAVIFFLLTYVMFTVAWYASDGLNPPMQGAMVGYAGNTCIIGGYLLWLRIFIFTPS